MTMSPARYAEIRALADRLVASCEGSAFEDIEIFNEMSVEECKVLDGMAFKCEDCDQWYDVYEMDGDTFICKRCAS
jgi:hypothetical protein